MKKQFLPEFFYIYNFDYQRLILSNKSVTAGHGDFK